MFKKLNFVRMLVVLFFSTCFLQTALANPLVINGDYAFLADGDLKIYNIKDPVDTDPEIIVVGGAVDVAISGTNAVVTVTDEDGLLSILIVDISEYIMDDSDSEEVGEESDSEEVGEDSELSTCENEVIADYDIDKGLLTISGIELNGKVSTIEMKRRGNSMNWSVSFIDNSDSGDVTDDADMDDSDRWRALPFFRF